MNNTDVSCPYCEAEFMVETASEYEKVTFCPFCGTELDIVEVNEEFLVENFLEEDE
jgi:uncharacterized Zn-finger protein